MHSYDHDPIFQQAVANAFNEGLDLAIIQIEAVALSDAVQTALIAKINALMRPVPLISDDYAKWASTGPLDDAPVSAS